MRRFLKYLFIITFIAQSTIFTCLADTFRAEKGQFLLNGEPFTIKAAELHYPRIPKEYWDQRIKLTKSLGMNTICLYTFWNVHETKEGEFDFSGQNDLREFIKLCEKNGMKVILRPGPYVCAEWEMGGLPWWLLKKKDIRLREDDPYFIERVERFQSKVAEQVGDLLITKGGPILMVQVENEYGAYGDDPEYVAKIRDILKKEFGEDILLFQCDWSSNFTVNGLPDLLWTMNFGTGADIDSQFAELKRLRPESPLMCSEYWSGWFDKWGAAHETRDADDMIRGIDEMLSKNISFSLYMTHGGTNWGHWAGANSPGFSPDVTSYDYDAPISENGTPTPKFWKLREVLKKYNTASDSLQDLPPLYEPVKIEKFTFTEVAPLWENLPEPVESETVKTMEELDMGYGSVLYSSTLPRITSGDILEINDPHDYAQVFIGGKFIAALDRRKGEKTIELGSFPPGEKLDILVEGMGRINFGRAIKDYKGITESVKILQKTEGKEFELKNWKIYLLPDELDFYKSMEFVSIDSIKTVSPTYPIGVYRGKFNVDQVSDTYLNFETWGKGLVLVNGYPLGRIWQIGPQQTLYTPGPWLKQGENEIMVFDIIGPEIPQSEGLESPIINKLNLKSEQSDSIITSEEEELGELVYADELSGGNGWKKMVLQNHDSISKLYILIESTIDETEKPSIAELYLLDEKGKKVERELWKIRASSEEKETGNHGSDKIIDNQESTYWLPGNNSVGGPWIIEISLPEPTVITGMEYLPRMESGAPGAIKGISIFAK